MNDQVDRRLKVMIDVSAVPYGRGVSRYTSNLVLNLAELRNLELTAFGYSRGQYRQLKSWLAGLPENVKTKAWPLSVTMVERLWQTTGQLKPDINQIEVFHAWEWQLPPLKKLPLVVTIHDLAYKLFPETAHPSVISHYDRLLGEIESNQQIRVIAVSQTTKQDILKLTRIEESRVHVVYESLPVESEIVPSAEMLAMTQFEFPKPFLLFVGTTEPRKNLTNIIQAWESVKDDFDLVIAGSVGWDEFKLKPGMHVLGYVPDEKLAALYRTAHALVYPSLYEGFGLPILEAYFHGCPVITSNTSSMSEIAGQPARLVNPENAAEIAEGILSIEAADTKARQKRQQDMRQVLEQFRWDDTAKQTMAVYQMAADESGV